MKLTAFLKAFNNPGIHVALKYCDERKKGVYNPPFLSGAICVLESEHKEEIKGLYVVDATIYGTGSLYINVRKSPYKGGESMGANVDIREKAKEAGVCLWQVAAAYGINDGNFSRKLRFELTLEEKEKILGIIERLAKENGNASN